MQSGDGRNALDPAIRIENYEGKQLVLVVVELKHNYEIADFGLQKHL
jgi:hypothetical protein